MDQAILPGNQDAVLSILRMLRPRHLKNVDKLRVGSMFDGGYVMLDLFKDVTAAYSFGINDDVSWDLDVARRGIPVYQYDHTIERLPQEHPLFHWEKVGISERREEQPRMETIEHLIEINGHQAADNLVLKCDIEGAEWGVLRNTPTRIMSRFSQIVLEMHSMSFVGQWPHCENVRATFAVLLSNHHVVHVHANNYGEWAIMNGVPIPETLELTLVRKDQGDFTRSEESFPTKLDMPCNSAAADYYLGRFDFA